MTSEFRTALELIRKLDETFPGTSSLIVGGAVRDRLLDIPSHDVDIATNVPFGELAKKFNLNDITKNTDNAQPVSIITFNGFSFEIAAFRSDSLGTDRKSNVATIVNTFEEDSARRDITVNAMGIDSHDRIVDPQNGRLDLIDGIVRCVGIPDERFSEDATRILRVFRFAAKLGFEIEIETRMSAMNNGWRISNRNMISPESIAKEFFKAAASGEQLARFIMHLKYAGILEKILPEFTALEGFTHDPVHHPEGGSTVIGHIITCLSVSRSEDPVVNLGILFHDLGKATTRGEKENGHSNYHGHEDAGVPITQGIFDRLRFPDLSADDKENILFAVSKHMLIHKIKDLSVKTLSKMILNPGWNILKKVSLADEACRGEDFDENLFVEKILFAEEKIARIASSKDDLRLKVKAFIDGNVVMDWFPEVRKNVKVLKPILSEVADFILESLDTGVTPTQIQIKFLAGTILSRELGIPIIYA